MSKNSEWLNYSVQIWSLWFRSENSPASMRVGKNLRFGLFLVCSTENIWNRCTHSQYLILGTIVTRFILKSRQEINICSNSDPQWSVLWELLSSLDQSDFAWSCISFSSLFQFNNCLSSIAPMELHKLLIKHVTQVSSELDDSSTPKRSIH